MSKKTSKLGRPPLPRKEALGEIFSVRLKPGEARQVRVAIDASGTKASEWLRQALVSKAERG